jgi:hypothetical protein
MWALGHVGKLLAVRSRYVNFIQHD